MTDLDLAKTALIDVTAAEATLKQVATSDAQPALTATSSAKLATQALVARLTPPPVAAFTVVSSIKDGATLTVPVSWTVVPILTTGTSSSVTSATKVQFFIDGVLTWTEAYAPFVFNGDPDGLLDPAKLTPGAHALKIVATGTAGTATTTVNVTVAGTTPPPPPPTTLTKILYAPVAGPNLDPVMNTTSASDKAYVQSHYYRIIKLWGSKWATFYKNGHVYIDIAAVYTGSPEATAHPDWVLKDASGHPVYIPWGAKNADGSYAQLAADQSNPGFRQYVLDRAHAALAAGYIGVHFDDANLPYSTDRTPYRGGQPLTDAQQKEDIASAIEWYRAQLGPTVEISANTRWFDDGPNHDATGAYTQRILKAVDWVCKEGGIIDGGLTTGTGSWSVDRLFRYCDNVHKAGKSVVWMSYTSDAKEATANLACYLLCRENQDMVSSDIGGHPSAPFPPYSIDPGQAHAARYSPVASRPDFWQRDFDHATVAYDHPSRTGTVVFK